MLSFIFHKSKLTWIITS